MQFLISSARQLGMRHQLPNNIVCNNLLLLIFNNYNTNNSQMPMQPNTTTANNTDRIQRIINYCYDDKEQELNLCTLVFTQMIVIIIGRA